MNDHRCKTCGDEVPRGWTSCARCTVVKRVGAEIFECECGQVVPIEESVRMMRKDTHKIERVCNKCVTEGACKAGNHVIQTPRKPGWDDSAWTFEPVPESFPKGFCSVCRQQLHFDGRRWARMDWVVLAQAWDATMEMEKR